MEVPMLGVIATVFAVLVSHRLGWDLTPGRKMLLWAGISFAFAMVLPAFAVVAAPAESVRTFVLGASVITGVGALLLVLGVLSFDRER
jgi:hypothetical protein